jgi:CrcB protein
MLQALAIAGGGAIGALMRFYASTGIYALFGRGFPYGTLFVNVSGSIVMGFLYVLFLERLEISPEMRAALLVGVLGAFTTFSTFSLETLNLMENGEMMKAMMNILLSVFLCLAGAWLGVLFGRQL